MSGIWVLSSVGRQKACQEVLDACDATGMTQPGLLVVDGEHYDGIRLPANWTKQTFDTNVGIGPVCQRVFEQHPDRDFYGFLADDTYPVTPGWDVQLSAAAGQRNVAYCADGGYIHEPALKAGLSLSGIYVMAGDLVRTVGWWALPGLRQAYVDVAWTELLSGLGRTRYLPDVLMEHKHWRNAKRPQDKWDLLTVHGDSGIVDADRAVYQAFLDSRAPARIRAML